MAGTQAKVVTPAGQGLFKKDFAVGVERADVKVIMIPGTGGNIMCPVFHRGGACRTPNANRQQGKGPANTHEFQKIASLMCHFLNSCSPSRHQAR
jgi:hypothetical protein